MIQFDEHIFQMGWFNHQLDKIWMKRLLSQTLNAWYIREYIYLQNWVV